MIYRIRSADLDPKGNPVGSEDRKPLPGAYAFPRESSDVDGPGRNGVVIGLGLVAPKGSDLLRTDQVEVAGEVYRIVGDVADWTHPLTGWEPGLACALERGEG